jgi:hypothetical protein
MLFCVVKVKKIGEIIFIGDLFKIPLDLSPRVFENCQSKSVLIIPPVEYFKRQSIWRTAKSFLYFSFVQRIIQSRSGGTTKRAEILGFGR